MQCNLPPRRRLVIGATTLAALLGSAACAPPPPFASPDVLTAPTAQEAPGVAWPTGTDALQRRSLDSLSTFTDWLKRGNAKGWIGEVGWPNDESSSQWNALANTWYQAADAEGLWVTAWAAGEWWGSYELGAYTASGASTDGRAPQADVLEANLGAAGADRGVNVNGGEFGIGCNLGLGSGCGFSNRNPGTYDVDYHYDSQASFDYLRSRGVELVRIPFRWERIQPSLNGELDGAEVARLQQVIARAGAAGLQVIPSVMNYGAYWDGASGVGVRTPIGSGNVTAGAFGDLWGRLSTSLGSNPSVIGWGLMNEPTELPGGAGAWEAASQAAVDAIRASGDTKTVLVPGYRWSTVVHFDDQHAAGPWIRDPANDVRYEAHQYFDSDFSGSYANSYDAEVADAQREGF